jgi:hypothetical protein
MRKQLIMALALSLLPGPAVAQDYNEERVMETVVVTGMMIDEDDLRDIPNATLRVKADFVLYELYYVNSTIEARDRKQEMERMYKAITREIPKHPTLKLKIGDASASADIETATFEEVYTSYGTQGRINFVVRAEVGVGDSFNQIRTRVEDFVEGAGEVGRSQSVLNDEQYLGVNDLKRYRPELIKVIWDDIYAISNPLGTTALDVSGLDGRTRYRPVGPLELELYIPFEVNFETKVER